MRRIPVDTICVRFVSAGEAADCGGRPPSCPTARARGRDAQDIDDQGRPGGVVAHLIEDPHPDRAEITAVKVDRGEGRPR
jgi:hypothetical protein